MSLFKKLLLPSALAIALMFVLGLAAYWALHTQAQQIDEINATNLNAATANALKADVLEAHSGAYRMITWATATDSSRLDEGTKALLVKLDQSSARFTQWSQAAHLSAEMRGPVKQIGERLDKYRKSVAQALDMASMDANTGVSAMQTADDDFKALEQSVSGLVSLSYQAAEQIRTQAAHNSQRMAMLIVALLLAALAVTGLISYLLARNVATNIQNATTVVERVASGDLLSAIDPGSDDEIGRLLDTLRTMQTSLREVIGAVGHSADTLHLTAGDMATAAKGINQAVEAQSESISSTAATVEQMTVSIGHVSENAEATRAVAAETAAVAEAGHRAAEEAAAGVQQILDKVMVASSTMKTLAESSEKIGAVANVISGIADQTNLLALNAAIEAARAGEQGRGFAVVADEVRKLAESTSKATHEIKSMIEAIQAQSGGAMHEMERASAEVVSGVRLIHGLREPLEHLRRGAGTSLSSLVELTMATREQRDASSVIARNVELIARKGEDNSTAALHSLALAQQLHQMADTLRASLTRFRV